MNHRKLFTKILALILAVSLVLGLIAPFIGYGIY